MIVVLLKQWRLKLVALFLLVSIGVATAAGTVVETDVCVYGGTSGGVVAAVAAARLGKTVTLISLNNHVGGMTASGLGVTDIGPGNDTSYVTGISREFYRRVGAEYGSSNLVIWFEPKVAERVFWQMLAEAGVPVYSNRLLAVTTVLSNRITQITTEDGTVFRAKQFIDTTYEGDLMAAAGVTFTWGREGTNVYGESLAGIRPVGGGYNYDPYVVPGNPASGFLPLVNGTNTGGVGQGDQRLQAYNFRLCLTQNPTNKIPIAPPTNYSEANYELVRRYVAARATLAAATNGSVRLSQLIDIQTIIPNGKTDINARDELSTDYVGYNYTWATNTYAGRAIIRQQHEDYIRGLLYFYATSTNIPATLNADAQSWGLAADEFTDNGGWPWQIYVREARRMVSDYIMTQSNCEARVTAPDGIALARYYIDSHGVQRLASGGFSRWEGSIGGTPPYPYPISYRSIIPRSNECQNVFSTFALSASHVAFASCRMEPVFMMTSHAAGVAAAFAIDDNVPVQSLNYNKLAAQLRADGQLLKWEAATVSTNGLILDEGDVGVTNSGGWTFGANAGGWNGDYLLDGIGSPKPVRSIRYTPTFPTNGTYEVYAWWVESSNRATNAIYDIIHANTGGATVTNRVLVNQRLSSGGWFKLFTTNFNVGQGHGVIIRNDGVVTNQYVVADGVRFLGLGGAAPTSALPVIEVVASDALAGEFGPDLGRFTFVRSGDTSAPVTINFTLSGSATAPADYQIIASSVVLAAGAVATNIVVTPVADAVAEGLENLTVTVSASATYQRTALSNATMQLLDRPVDAWRAAEFTVGELSNPAISGDDADPDGDRLPNLVEFGLGLSPRSANPNPFQLIITNGVANFRHSENKAATDVTLTVEWSPDLPDWFSGPSYLQITDVMDAGAVRWLTWTVESSLTEQSRGFLRLRAQRD